MNQTREQSYAYSNRFYPKGAQRGERNRRKKQRRRHRIRWVLFALLLCVLFAEAKNIKTLIELSRVPEGLRALYKRNPDARQYVLDYGKEHDRTHRIDLSEYADAKKVPLLMQWDERWGYNQYAGNFFGLTGCGPTCMSMVDIYLTGDTKKTPAFMGKFAAKHGYAAAGSGTAWSFITEGGRRLGLDATEIPLDQERIDQNLNAGNPIICIMGPGVFTTGGHFIVITKKENGKYRINDPNSYRNSKKQWIYEEFSDQIRDLWVMRKL